MLEMVVSDAAVSFFREFALGMLNYHPKLFSVRSGHMAILHSSKHAVE
jgi:hypothetical protein